MRSKEQLMQKTWVVWLGAMICCALWGSAFPFVKIGYRLFEIPSEDVAAQILFAGYRFTLAGILVIFFGSLLSKQFLHPVKRNVGRVIWLSLLQTVLQYFFFYIGLANTSGVKASIIEAMNVFVAIIVASLIFKQEKLTVDKMAGCAIGFIGVILVNLNGMNLQFQINGEGFIFFSTVAYAFSSVFMKKYSVQDHPVMLSGYQFLVGGIIMILGGIMMGGKIHPTSGHAVLLLLYMAALSATAYSIWGILLKYNPVSKVSVFGFMNPVFGFILSAILLNEGDQAGGILCVLSLILVCTGIFIVNHPKKTE